MKKLSALILLLAVLFVPAVVFANGQKDEAPAASAPAVAEVKTGPVEEAAMAYFADFPGNRIISTEKLIEKIDAGEDFLILDIRRPEDYAEAHLKGAVNAPWGPAIADALNWLPDDIPVYVSCYSGQTAGQAVAVLNVAGIPAESVKYGYNLGISKTEGIDAYLTADATLPPEASGVKIDPKIRKAAEDYFNMIPDMGSNIWPAAKVKEMLDAEDLGLVVSIRRADDYAAGHIQGAVNIPWGAGMQEKFSMLPKDETFVVHCYSGQTAGQAVGVLRLLGYDAVSMKSGMGTAATGASGWVNEGFPVVQ